MTFWDKLKKVAPYVEKGVNIAVKAESGDKAGAALDAVDLALNKSRPEDADRINAAAIDDHEARLRAVEVKVGIRKQ
jgi:hypothetical protein